MLKDDVIAVLKTVYDPEIPVNIYELGLVYDVSASEQGDVGIRMTLTAPSCPVAGILPGQVEMKVRALAGVRDVKVELVFDPPWSKDKMSEQARFALGMDDVVPIRSYPR